MCSRPRHRHAHPFLNHLSSWAISTEPIRGQHTQSLTTTLTRVILSAAEESRRISRHPYRLKLPLHKRRSPFAPRANSSCLSPRLQIGVPGERHFVRWGEHRPERSRRRSEPFLSVAPNHPVHRNAPQSHPRFVRAPPQLLRNLSVKNCVLIRRRPPISAKFGVLSCPIRYN